MSDVYTAHLGTLGRCLCIITGASKGFGRALAHKVSKQHVKKIINEVIRQYNNI